MDACLGLIHYRVVRTSVSSPCLRIGWILLALHSAALAQSAAPPLAPPAWPVTSAPARFNLEPGSFGSRVGYVPLYLPNPQWANMPIRVFTDTGVAVGSDVLWTSPGEPVTLLLDETSGAKRYNVYVGSNWPPLHLPDPKAGVWIETRQGDGKTINSLPEMLQAWNQSKDIKGRAICNAIFEGGNRFGPEGNLLVHLQGWFDVAAPETLEMSPIASDASFVLVDGKEVAEWPGLHDRWTGTPAAPPHGSVDLTAGTHVLDYYNAYVATPGGNPPLTCCLAVKGGAFQNWSMIFPGVSFFRTVAFGGTELYQLQSGTPAGPASAAIPPLAIKWSNQEQSVISTDLAPDIGFIALQLSRLPPELTPDPAPGTVTWTFDDGSTAQGQAVTHLFPRPGMRTVRVSLSDGGKEIASFTQTISVHPDWANPNKQPDLHPEHEADIMARDPATLSPSDLAGCFALFGFYLKDGDLLKFLPAVCAKLNQISDADLPDIKNAALFLARDDWSHTGEEIQLLRSLIDRTAQDKIPAQADAIASPCRLALARLTLKVSPSVEDVTSILNALNVSTLTGEEPRRLAILKADLALAAGDVAGARKQYIALTGEPSGPDVRSSIRRTAKISQARAFIDRKDFDAAEDALNEVARNAPIEKLSSDWALTRLRLYQEENLAAVAYIFAKRLLPVLVESGRSELLFRTTDLAFAQNDPNLAKKTLTELLLKHPYSEEAAQAKEKWPGQG
jgi:hypothetical protein